MTNPSYTKPTVKRLCLQLESPILSGSNKYKEPIKTDTETGLEKRRHIQHFLSDTQKAKDTLIRFIVEDQEKIFFGYEYVLTDGQKIVYYIFPIDIKNKKALIFLCIDNNGNIFDDLLNNLNSRNISYFKATWPLFAKFIENYTSSKFSNPFLLPFDISGDKFYCVAKMLENVSIADYESDYVIQRLTDLCNQVISAIIELNEKEMSTATKARYFITEGLHYYTYYIRANRIIDFLGL